MISFAPLPLDAVEFLSQQTGIEFGFVDFTDPRWFCVSARGDDGALQGVLVGEFKQWFDCYLTIAVTDRRCMSARVLAAIFTALFSRARRITARIPAEKRWLEKQLRQLGFQYEGFLRRGYDGTRDALLFGMLPEDSVWLNRARKRAARRAPPIIIGGDHGRHARPA